jgi:hypothetical protein
VRLWQLGVVYVLVGVGAAIHLWRSGRRGIADLSMTVLLWPVALPVALSSSAPPAAHPEFRALLAALTAARSSDLSALLPSEQQIAPLGEHLRRLDERIAELSSVLAHEEAGPRSPGPVQAGVERLRALRERTAQEREELLALCARLRMQLTVLRFTGPSAGDAELGPTITLLLGRLEGLGEVLG